MINYLKGLPSAAWTVATILVLCLGLYVFVSYRTARAFDAGYASALTKAAAVESVYVDRVVTAQAKTDTVWRRTKTLIDSVPIYVTAVPESIRVAFPVVDTTLRVCSEAANSCLRFREQVLVERVMTDSLTGILRLGTVARHDSINTLRKRPTRLRAFVTAVGTGVVGYAAGRRGR